MRFKYYDPFCYFQKFDSIKHVLEKNQVIRVKLISVHLKKGSSFNHEKNKSTFSYFCNKFFKNQKYEFQRFSIVLNEINIEICQTRIFDFNFLLISKTQNQHFLNLFSGLQLIDQDSTICHGPSEMSENRPVWS